MHNRGCHLDNGKLHHRDTEILLLQKTFHALTKAQGYQLNSLDRQFIDAYYHTHFKDIYI